MFPFPALSYRQVLSSHWFLVLLNFVMIGCCDLLDLSLTFLVVCFSLENRPTAVT